LFHIKSQAKDFNKITLAAIAAAELLLEEQSIGSKQYLEQDNQLGSSIMDHQHD
jgi:hypothetical protein